MWESNIKKIITLTAVLLLMLSLNIVFLSSLAFAETTDKPVVSINGKQAEILMVNQNAQVIISVTSNNIPLPGKKVVVEGFAEGTTNGNGIFTSNITPGYGKDIGIWVDDTYYYKGILFAVENNQGVVEVKAKDRQGNDMDNFWVRVTSQNVNNYIGEQGKAARVLAFEGHNLLLLNYQAANSNDSYNIVKNITVTPGIINTENVDSANTVQADMAFNYNGSPIVNGEIIIEKTDASNYGYMHGYLGRTNSMGQKRVYVTPGPYMVTIKGSDSQSNLIYLVKYNQQINASAPYAFQWTASEVGKLKLNITSSLQSMTNKAIVLNGSEWVFLGNSTEITVSNGTYKLNKIRLENIYNNTSMYYHYRKPKGQEETFTINSTNPVIKDIDLTPGNVSLKVYDNAIQPGTTVHFGIESSTPSEYLLEGIRDRETMDVTISKPNGSQVNFRQYMRNGTYNIWVDEPIGTWSINARGNLDPLYGPYNLNTTFIVKKPELTINAKQVEVLRVGQSSSVTFEVTENGLPYSNKKISIDGYPDAEGYTDSNGRLIINITPRYSGELTVRVADQFKYKGILFALDPQQGVVEVKLRDSQGGYVESFCIHAQSQKMNNWTDGEGTVTRIMAYQGPNTLAVSYRGTGDNASYYIGKYVDVTPGQVNTIEITSADYVETNLNFKYNGANISNSEIFLGKYFTDIGYQNKNLGFTNQVGLEKVYVSPGSFRVIVKGADSEGTLMYLIRENQQIDGSVADYYYEWDASETGKLQTNIISPLTSITGRAIALNYSWISMGQRNEIRISQGTYKINNIHIENKINNNNMFYDYSKPWEAQDFITVASGSVVPLNVDLTPGNVVLKIYSNFILPGEGVHFGVEPMTPSGYMLRDIRDKAGVSVTIQKPDGTNANFQSRFDSIWYGIGQNDPNGRYGIHVDGDLSPLYGPYSLDASFIVGRPEVSVDKLMIPAGQDTQVTVNVKINGQPAPGMNISIEGCAGGITDSNGEFTSVIHPGNGRHIGLWVDKLYYSGLLFSIENDQGVVEVNCKDKQGNVLENIYVRMKSQYMQQDIQGEGSVTRILAREGENMMLVAYTGNDSYYIVQDINVTAGILNRIQAESNSCIEANISFSYNGSPYPDSEVILGKKDDRFGFVDKDLGVTNAEGRKRIYVTPGSYRVAAAGWDDDQDVQRHLIKNDQNLIVNGSYSYAWNAAETGILEFNIAGSLPSIEQKVIVLDGWWVHLGNKNKVRLCQGSYGINKLHVETNSNNSWIGYDYIKPWDQPKDRVVIGSTPFSFCANLDLKEKRLILFSDSIKQGDNVQFGIYTLTNSGYLLSWSSASSEMHVFISKPDGRYSSFTQGYPQGNFQIYNDDPVGIYNMSVDGNISPYYGPYDFSTTFAVKSAVDSKLWVNRITPDYGAIDVPVSTDIELDFNQTIKSGNNFDNITLKDFNNNNVNISKSIVNNLLKIKPVGLLNYSTHYILSIPYEAVLDAGTNMPNNGYVSNFTTKSYHERLRVISTNPEADSRDIPVDIKDINVFFNNDISGGAEINNIEMQGPDSKKVGVTASINKNVLTIKPGYNLKNNTTYLIKVPRGAVQDFEGSTIEATDHKFCFTTKAESVKIKVKDTIPNIGSTDVLLDTNIIVMFNKNINLVVNTGTNKKTQNITLQDTDKVDVPIACSIIQDKLVIKPKSSLSPNTGYKLIIPQNIVCDADKNMLHEIFTLEFTTVGSAVNTVSVTSINDITEKIYENDKYELPKTVKAVMSDSTIKELPVVWNKSIMDTSKSGTYKLEGTVEGYDKKVNLTLIVLTKKVKKVKKPVDKERARPN